MRTEVIETLHSGSVVTYFDGVPVLQRHLINMEPFGKERPRVTQNGTYMRESYRRKKSLLRERFGPVVIEGMLKLSIVAFRPMPQGWSESKRRMMMGEPAKPAPDIDNIIGAVMDALFPQNDDHVVSLEAHKVWGEGGAIQITIEKMGD
jgi:Holliday junction resolvase RusA-like endonuclease